MHDVRYVDLYPQMCAYLTSDRLAKLAEAEEEVRAGEARMAQMEAASAAAREAAEAKMTELEAAAAAQRQELGAKVAEVAARLEVAAMAEKRARQTAEAKVAELEAEAAASQEAYRAAEMPTAEMDAAVALKPSPALTQEPLASVPMAAPTIRGERPIQ